MAASPGFWDTVRSWADSVGILSPDAARPGEKPKVPEAVCANCPICQGAATVDQLDHDAIADYVDLARNVVLGLGSALASAAEQRIQGEAVESGAPDAPAPEATHANESESPKPPRRVKRKPRPPAAEESTDPAPDQSPD